LFNYVVCLVNNTHTYTHTHTGYT